MSCRTFHLYPVFNYLEICIPEATLGIVVDSRRYTGLNALILEVPQCFDPSVMAVSNNHLVLLANCEKEVRVQVMDLRHIVIGGLRSFHREDDTFLSVHAEMGLISRLAFQTVADISCAPGPLEDSSFSFFLAFLRRFPILSGLTVPSKISPLKLFLGSSTSCTSSRYSCLFLKMGETIL